MRFPCYPQYRDSGVEWLGEVPGHWEVWKLSHAFEIIGSGTTPNSDHRSYYDDGDIAWLNTGDLNDGDVFDCEKRITALALEKHSSLKVYPPGSLAIAMYGATIGRLGVLHFSTTVNQACCIFSGNSHITPGFLFYWLLGFRKQIVSMATGGGQPNISQEILRNLRAACPAPSEQVLISKFLDSETAKLDGLMAEQEELIALLKEKRQAMISHAVTNGLDPAVPMKDSGVEWMGKVPQHWEVAHLKRFCLEITDGAHISPDTEGGVYHFVSTKDLSGETIDFDRALLTSESSYDYLLKTGCRPFPGDVLFSKDGTIGKTVVVRDDREFVVASSLIIIRPDMSILDADYLNFLCKSFLVAAQVESFVKGAGLPRLSIQNLLKVLGVFPPKGEQEKIAEFLLGKQTQFDALITAAESAIDLLKEHRTALIFAAVTGKIDVRGLVTEEEEKAA